MGVSPVQRLYCFGETVRTVEGSVDGPGVGPGLGLEGPGWYNDPGKGREETQRRLRITSLHPYTRSPGPWTSTRLVLPDLSWTG